MRRLALTLTLAALLAWGAPAAALAATVAERSPFTQGQWWDPTRPGNGFELFNVGDEVMALWFTFDTARSPIWYTAQGKLGETWTLLSHTWSPGSGQRGTSLVEGTLKLEVLDDSQADVSFRIGERTGTWRIEPFNPGARSNEVDHSGSYYDPTQPGWGFTLTEQGEVLGGVLYYYSQYGFPTWVAGFSRGGTGSVGVVSVSGTCPGCPGPYSTTRLDGGRIDIERLTENLAVLRTNLANPMAPGLAIDGARIVQLGRPASTRLADRLPASFASAPELKAYYERVMRNMAFGIPGVQIGPDPTVDAPERAQRLQDSGADECDLVRSNGRYAYTFGHDGVTRPMAHLRVAEIGAGGRSVDVRGDGIALSSGFNTPTDAAVLCLGADTLVTIAGTQPFLRSGTVSGYMKGRTYVEVFGLADPARPASRWWAEFEGHMLTSFRIGERLYVVLRHAPTVQGLDYRFLPSSDAMNRQVLAAAPLSVLTPQVRALGGEATALVPVASTYLAPQGWRRRADHVAVVAIDLRSARIVDALAVLAPVQSAHLSGEDLYLAGTMYPGAGSGPPQGTQIYHVRLGTSAMSFAGTGRVEGVVPAGAFHAARGQLRVVSTLNTGDTRLTILEPGIETSGFLHAAWSLPNSTRSPLLPVHGISRFTGDRLFIASGDSLGVVDLADPRDPKLASLFVTRGPLESLHPLPDGRLLATGHEVGFFGIPADLHLTLYDMRDAASPREVQRVRVASSSGRTPLREEPYALNATQLADGSTAIAFPARLPVSAPGVESGLVRFELRGTGSFNAGFARFPDLLGAGAAPLPGARALLYPEGVIYISAGKFWRQDDTGNVTGPF